MLVLAVALAAMIAGALWMYDRTGPASAGGLPRRVIVPPGAGVAKIADVLARAKVVWSGSAVIIAAELTGAAPRLKAGEYEFPSGASLARVLRAMEQGAVVRHFVTIPEGLTSRAAADILAHADYLTGPALPAPEGSLLPETYEARRGESRAAVTKRMMAAQTSLLDALWPRRAKTLPYQTPAEAVVLASIVEKETARAAERPRIAAVFINRLKAGMRLESDPTVIYGLTGGSPLGHGLRVSELASRTAYNTYLVGGLPPTPIGNPGRAALIAALNPAPGDDLYFVADGSGGHVFADTFEAHRRNVAKWRAMEKAALKSGAKP